MAAPKTKEKGFDLKKFNKEMSGFMFKKPERDDQGNIKTQKYKTNILPLDTLLNGGFPQGRVIGLGAEWGVGKTTALIQACSNIIDTYNKRIYYIDIEGGATYELFEAMGCAHHIWDAEENPEGMLYLINVTTIQMIAKITKQVCTDDNTAVIVYDSDTQVVDQLDLDKDDLGTSNNAIGARARMWSKAAGPLLAVVKMSHACLVIVHQARMDLTGFRPRIVASGGNAIKHMASAEIWGKRKAWIGEDNVTEKVKKEDAIGALVEFSTTKNRLGLPFRKVMFPIFFGKGVSNLWVYKDWLIANEWLDKASGELIPYIKVSGSWFQIELPGIVSQKVQGGDKVNDFIKQYAEEIGKIIEESGGVALAKTPEPENEFDEE